MPFVTRLAIKDCIAGRASLAPITGTSGMPGTLDAIVIWGGVKMSFLDIAAALASQSLTLFIGTGFSKYLTDNNAPSWLELLVQCTREIDPDEELLESLFVLDEENKQVIDSKYDLTICAQVLELEYQQNRRDIREEVCSILNEKIKVETINTEKVNDLSNFFQTHSSINIITTNYDNLISNYIIPETSRVFVERSAFARTNLGHNVYHVHGCISRPKSIILTLNDYFNFQHQENFFSRKVYTLLQESTVVILGYSLGDFNLNRILNEAQNTRGETLRRGNIYYISRSKIDEIIKKYYLNTYGIIVIDKCDIKMFFEKLETEYDEAKSLIIEKAPNLRAILSGERVYKDKFIRLRDFLNRVLLRASIIGIDSNDEDFQKLLITLLKKKKEFTYDNSAWEQYSHLAEWLIDVGSLVTLENSIIKEDYLDIVDYSFRHMSKDQYIGYSWDAYQIWSSRWHDIKIQNQELLLDYFKDTRFAKHTGVNKFIERISKN